MTIQQSVYTALTSLVGGRVHPSVAPDQQTLPFIVYNRVSSVPTTTLADGQPIQQTRMQVDIYAATYSAAQALADQVRDALIGSPLYGVQLMEFDGFEEDIKVFRVVHDYSFWHAT